MPHQSGEAHETNWRSRLLSLATVVIWIAMIVWGFQLRFDFSKERFAEMDRENRHNQQGSAAMSKFCDPLEERSVRLGVGRGYRPKQMFADFRAVHLRNRELGYPKRDVGLSSASDSVAEGYERWMHQQMGQMSQYDRDLHQEYLIEWAKFDEWKIKYCPDPPAGGETMVNQLRQAGWARVGFWFWTFYWHILLLAPFLYFVRMRQRNKGVLATILADKKAFVVAMLVPFWGIFRYPYNVVREIAAEAEVRRLKDKLLVPLTIAERLWVREVASSSDWQARRASFRIVNASFFQRSFVVALLGTLVCLFLFPLLTVKPVEASTKGTNAVFTARAGPTVQVEFTRGASDDDQATDSFTASGEGLVPDLPTLSSIVFLWTLPREVVLRIRKTARDVVHVPILGYVVSQSSNAM